jgi:hypothetical protein
MNASRLLAFRPRQPIAGTMHHNEIEMRLTPFGFTRTMELIARFWTCSESWTSDPLAYVGEVTRGAA